jgi:hypothetical protein
MSQTASIRVTVIVDVEPTVAFEVFTQETASWYRPTIPSAPRQRGGQLRFDEVARRILRATEGGGEAEVGHITVWEPPYRLVFVDRRETEVEVVFEPFDDQTRVTLEHRGLDRLPPDEAASVTQYGWRRLAFQFEAHFKQLRVRGEESR